MGGFGGSSGTVFVGVGILGVVIFGFGIFGVVILGFGILGVVILGFGILGVVILGVVGFGVVSFGSDGCVESLTLGVGGSDFPVPGVGRSVGFGVEVARFGSVALGSVGAFVLVGLPGPGGAAGVTEPLGVGTAVEPPGGVVEDAAPPAPGDVAVALVGGVPLVEESGEPEPDERSGLGPRVLDGCDGRCAGAGA